MKQTYTLIILFGSLFLFAGCATVDHPRHTSEKYSELMSRYSTTAEPLQLRKLTHESSAEHPEYSGPNEVFIIVHPAYSMFFRDLSKDIYSDEKFTLLKNQFDHEEQIIEEQIAAGKVVILVLPGNFLKDSYSPQGYISYLNGLTLGGQSLYYVFSETSSSGVLPANDMVTLYLFLQALNPKNVMVGGGYIGRCQREFYNQLTSYVDNSHAFIVPELSTISLEDVTDEEAVRIVDKLRVQNYSPIKAFIDKKAGGKANILSIP